MNKGDQNIIFNSTATAGDFFELIVVNFLILVFTFGIGAAWVEMRIQKFIFNHVKMNGDINLEEIQQTEENYTDAFGEDAMDFMDIEV